MGELCFACLMALSAAQGSAAPPPSQPSSAAPAIASPPAPRPHGDRWLRLALLWGATAFDFASSEYALNSNPQAYEASPLFRNAEGRLSAGRYWAISAPLNSLATYMTWKHDSRVLRVLTYVAGAARAGAACNNLRYVH